MFKRCTCGSNLPRYDLRDAAGTFCTFVCTKCFNEKKARFNPDIFDADTLYAISGEEQDIGLRRYR